MRDVVPSKRGRRTAVPALLLTFAVAAAGCRGSDAPVASPGSSDPSTTGVSTTVPELHKGVTLIAAPNGVLLPVLSPVPDGFKVATPCGNEAVAKGQAVEAIDVVLDPGHGGEESGAVGPNGLREKDLNATVAGFARVALSNAGVRVIPTRNGDYRMTLGARGLLNAAAKPKAFVSIHHNAGSNAPSPRPGTDVYYQATNPEAKRLGGLIHEEVVKSLSSIKGVTWAAGAFPGVKIRLNETGEDYFGVVRRTAGTPGVLVEMGFISNPSEAAIYADRKVQQLEGDAVARGILRFLKTKDPGSGFVDVPDPKLGAMGGGGGGPQGCVDPPV
jgi:N-acetylmuramoyl-L-alanine amidase